MRKRKERNDAPIDPMLDPTDRADLEQEVRLVQRRYACRPSSRWHLQLSLESYIKSFTMRNNWRPRWITPAAAQEIVRTGGVWNPADKRKHPLQRCHGSVPGAMRRSERFKKVLAMTGDPIEKIWDFFMQHDSSVLALKTEHKTNKVWQPSALIPIPDPPDGSPILFYEDGMSVIVGPAEVAWVRKALGVAAPPAGPLTLSESIAKSPAQVPRGQHKRRSAPA